MGEEVFAGLNIDKFNKPIFMGNGDYSQGAACALIQKVENAIEILGGLQQPGHPESEEEWEIEKKIHNDLAVELQDLVCEIALALGIKVNVFTNLMRMK